MSFEKLGLVAELSRAVAEKGYSKPTPIQAQAIPYILEGRDIMGGAQTGTGKTAGFTLPLLQRLFLDNKTASSHRAVRALVLTPTRELAAQVHDNVRDYAKYLPLRSTLVHGGVGIGPQISKLRKGVDVLVATPGRLLDHLQQNTVTLKHVDVLVLDEADRMLDMGFIRDIRKILEKLPKQKQTLLFSATFSDEIKQLAGDLLEDPAMVEVVRHNTAAERVGQRIHPVDKSSKQGLLSYLVGSNNWQQVLVFARTKHGADNIAKKLERDGIKAGAIHGNKSQGARTRALKSFKEGGIRVLVATDIAARGIDIDALPHVINFDLPNVAEDYVHRIGRTGRAGKEGEAISLVCAEEMEQLVAIERLIKRPIERAIIDGFEPKQELPTVLSGKSKTKSKPRTGRSGRLKPKAGRKQGGQANATAGSGRRRRRRSSGSAAKRAA